METSPPAITMGPPSNPGVESDANGTHDYMSMGDHHNTGSLPGPNAAAAAAAGAQQPKVVQTAFIHKLYKYGLVDCELWNEADMSQYVGGPEHPAFDILVYVC